MDKRILVCSALLVLLISCGPQRSPEAASTPSTTATVRHETAATPESLSIPTLRQVGHSETPACPTRQPLPTAQCKERQESPGAPGLVLDPQTFTPGGTLKDELSFQDYTIRIYQDRPCHAEYLQIIHQGQCVYAQEGRHLKIGSVYSDEVDPIAVGQDITGNGVPNLVVIEFTGGMACCLAHNVFELGDRFRLIGQLVANTDDHSHFTDLDGDHNWEFVTSDWTYMWNWGPHIPQLQLPVILHFHDGTYRLAYDLMRKPAPDDDDLNSRAQQIRGLEWDSWSQRIALESFLRNLVYSGHAEMVDPFLDMVWPAPDPGKAEYQRWFVHSFSKSPYWPEIKYLSEEWPWPEE